ncbi:MAG: YggT family protein [Chromatiales bacterium]|nr:YggT family protein [Chromatiales bacterium]
MNGYLTNPLIFLVSVVFGLYALALLLRFLLQVVRADFYNPLSQFLVRITNPVVRPARRLIPGLGGLDLASLLLAWLVKSLEIALLIVLTETAANPLRAFAWAIPDLVELTIFVFLVALFVRVVLSWINGGGYNLAATVIYDLTSPLLRPIRRWLPSDTGGIDFSPLVAGVVLMLGWYLILPPLRAITGTG